MVNTASIESKPRISSNEEVRAFGSKPVGKVLLLSSVPPSSKYTGALMLHSMCRALPAANLSCFSVLTPGMDSEIHPDWKDIPYVHRQKPSESHIRHLPLHLGVIESFIKEQATATFATSRIARELVAFAESHGVERIWCTLEGQTMIRLARAAQKHLALPMVAQVWDPPGWRILLMNLNR